MEDEPAGAESLLPYSLWTEEALRMVVRRALEQVARDGLPGEHHFFLTFRTTHPGVDIPGHLRARYPQEMTIVLQHRFWDLAVNPKTDAFTVGLSFGGVASKLVVPFAALTAFADPQVRFGLRFQGEAEAPEPEAAEPEPEPAPAAAEGQVVRLDAFRRRPRE